MKIVTYLIAALALAPNLFAQTTLQVNYSAAPGQARLFTEGGTIAVADNNAVWIGTFNPGFNVAANATRPDLLMANWHSFGNTTTRSFVQPGYFTGSSQNTDPFFGAQKIYLWIFSTINAQSPNTVDFSNVDEYGLFSANLANWSFAPYPPPAPPGNLRSINTSEINQPLFGNLNPGQIVLSSGFVAVPEPSTLALLGIAIPAVILALRKRR